MLKFEAWNLKIVRGSLSNILDEEDVADTLEESKKEIVFSSRSYRNGLRLRSFIYGLIFVKFPSLKVLFVYQNLTDLLTLLAGFYKRKPASFVLA